MPSNLRIHIVPVGFEFQRVTQPLIDKQADKVYLVTFKKDDDAKGFFSKIKKELSQNYKHIQVEEVFLDIWDLYECIEEFRKIILREEGNHVYVNVSTGTKITAIAGMLSCMLWNATPYYAPISYPDRESKSMPSEHVLDSKELPTYDIKKPERKYMHILELLKSNGGTMRKSKIISELEEMGMLRTTDQDRRELKGPAKHSQLRALLNPMEQDWKFVQVKASGRRSEVTITNQGKNALRIFSCVDMAYDTRHTGSGNNHP